MNKAYTSAFNSAFKKASNTIKNPSGISALILQVGNKLASGKSSLKDIKNDLSVLVKLIKQWSLGNYKNVSNKTVITIIATLLYFVNPLDLIPDVIPIIGFTDDATILLYVLNLIGKEVDDFKDWERLNTINQVSKK